ncbi:MAG: FadR/GntR family transcriptional regulator, partial [Streptosporangiaceae bacterium]
MPDQPASAAGPPASRAGPPAAGSSVAGSSVAGSGPPGPAAAGPAPVGWRWMGSHEPLFLRVAEQIEHFVAGNELAPGDRLPGERELCDLLGVSRASVREALRSLETRGVVRVQHGKGVFVAAPDEGERAMQRFSRLREV